MNEWYGSTSMGWREGVCWRRQRRLKRGKLFKWSCVSVIIVYSWQVKSGSNSSGKLQGFVENHFQFKGKSVCGSVGVRERGRIEVEEPQRNSNFSRIDDLANTWGPPASHCIINGNNMMFVYHPPYTGCCHFPLPIRNYVIITVPTQSYPTNYFPNNLLGSNFASSFIIKLQRFPPT